MPNVTPPWKLLAEASDKDVHKYSGLRGGVLTKLRESGFDLKAYEDAQASLRGLSARTSDAKRAATTQSYISEKRKVLQKLAGTLAKDVAQDLQTAAANNNGIVTGVAVSRDKFGAARSRIRKIRSQLNKDLDEVEAQLDQGGQALDDVDDCAGNNVEVLQRLPKQAEDVMVAMHDLGADSVPSPVQQAPAPLAETSAEWEFLSDTEPPSPPTKKQKLAASSSTGAVSPPPPPPPPTMPDKLAVALNSVGALPGDMRLAAKKGNQEVVVVDAGMAEALMVPCDAPIVPPPPLQTKPLLAHLLEEANEAVCGANAGVTCDKELPLPCDSPKVPATGQPIAYLLDEANDATLCTEEGLLGDVLEWPSQRPLVRRFDGCAWCEAYPDSPPWVEAASILPHKKMSFAVWALKAVRRWRNEDVRIWDQVPERKSGEDDTAWKVRLCDHLWGLRLLWWWAGSSYIPAGMPYLNEVPLAVSRLSAFAITLGTEKVLGTEDPTPAEAPDEEDRPTPRFGSWAKHKEWVAGMAQSFAFGDQLIQDVEGKRGRADERMERDCMMLEDHGAPPHQQQPSPPPAPRQQDAWRVMQSETAREKQRLAALRTSVYA